MNRILNMKDFGKNWKNVVARYPSAVYVGREMKMYGLVGSALANPFRVKDGEERGSTIENYKKWLWAKIKNGDEGVLAALHAIGPDTALVCWCAPLPCHAEVVAKAAEWLRNQG